MTPTPPTAAARVARAFPTCAFLLVAALIVLDATPRLGGFGRFAERIDPVMDVTGLWQGPWNLFAPDVDKVNTRVSAELQFTGRVKMKWNSPDWERLSSWDRFTRFREQEYFDTLRLDDNRGAWTPFALYLSRILPPRGTGKLLRITLTRRWAEIPPPETRWLPARPYTQFDGSYVFFTWKAPRTR